MAAKDLTKVIEFIDIEARCQALGCNVPTGFAILPRNFESAASKSDLIHEDTTPTVRALFAEKGIVETRIEQDGEKLPYFEENSYEWIGPIIFVGATVFSQNPNLITVGLGVVSNYLTDYFKGRIGEKNAKISLVIPQPNSKKYTRINYDGPVDGIKDLEKLIKEVRRGKVKK